MCKFIKANLFDALLAASRHFYTYTYASRTILETESAVSATFKKFGFPDLKTWDEGWLAYQELATPEEMRLVSEIINAERDKAYAEYYGTCKGYFIPRY